MSYSIVEFFPDSAGRSCGYCKGKDGNFSHGMWAHVMKPQDYEDLINRGWRRCGKYCYKPTLKRACCPMYTIRSNALEFKPSKSHKKIMKKFRNYIEKDAGGDKLKITPVPELSADVLRSLEDSDEDSNDSEEGDEMQKEVETAEKKLKFGGAPNNLRASASSSSKEESRPVPDEGGTQKKVPRPGAGPDPNKPRARKAKEIRLERKKAKSRGEHPPKVEKQEESDGIEDIFDQLINPRPGNKHKFEIKLVKAKDEDPEFLKTFEKSYNVYKKYQVAIHKDKVSKVSAKQFRGFLCSSPLIEHDDRGRHETPGRIPESFFPRGYGGYHQQYWVDDNLVCVGVLDILPTCISSVYLYYDPDYSFLSCGTLSTLMEMMFVRNLHKYWSRQITNYYMGFYIHSCPKMRYKGQYEPSWLLCPETYEWIDIKSCTPLLDQVKYTRFNVTSERPDEATIVPPRTAVSEVGVLHNRTAMTYSDFDSDFIHRKSRTEEDEEIFNYYLLVGQMVARRMLLYRA